MASSSSSAPQWRYDVFLSFRGPDTRKSITSELYDQLQNKRGINTFMDDSDLQVGDVISPTLLTAIEESRFAIVVLSKDYASSTWCLEELTKICHCMKDGNIILPVFYQVDPTDIRFQKNSFEEAFIKHENSGRHVPEKVQQWRDALKIVANFSGWHTNGYKSDKELVATIVEYVCTKVGHIEIKTGDFEIFAATRRAMEKVMKALEDDRVTAIGVYGMGGVGKTTMVKHVGAQARKNGIFDHMIMATVSQSPNRRNIQGTYADMMRIKLVAETEDGRALELNEQILRRNKVLIILDDIWAGIDLSSIGIPNQEELERCKSKVLITTRVNHNCHEMRCQEEICLDTLSENDSWTLFVRNAGRSFESTEFEKVARRVVGECGGLPIALIAVAKALGDKDLEEWIKASRRLEKSQTANLDDRGEAFKCIKLSYDYLKDEDSKSCFLLCCLFPEDDDIEAEKLFRYSFGKGLFRDADTVKEARGTAISVVKHLKSCSLLLDCEEEGCVRMHDVIRDTAIEITKSMDSPYFVKAGCGLKDWPLQLDAGDYSVVSLMKNDIHKLPEKLVCPKLQLLLLSDNYNLNDIPYIFLESVKDLRVLDLSGSSFSLLPQSFSLLSNLQALCLDFCPNSIDTSILGNLKQLEILSMRCFRNKKLSAEIGQLTNLRMLDISGGRGIVTIPSKVISKLHRLEELYMLDCGFKHWGSSVEENSIDFEVPTTLQKIKVRTTCNPLLYFANWGRNFFEDCRRCIFEDKGSIVEERGSIFEGQGEEINNFLFRFEEKESIVEGEGEGEGEEIDNFLFGFEERESFVEGEGEDINNIRLAELVGLTNLNILQINIADAKCIPVKVDVKPNWVYFDIRIGRSPTDTLPLPRVDSPKNSRYLSLEGTTIAMLPDWFVNAVTEKTEELRYHRCRGLRYILMEFEHGRLNELKRLHVYSNYSEISSDDLVELMNSTTLRDKTKPVFKNLEELHLKYVGALKELCVGELPPESLSNLHVLDVQYCRNLENVSIFLQRLPNLETLHLKINDVIEYVFETTGLQPHQSKLREMRLLGLHALRSISSGPIQHPMFQTLKLMVIHECRSLRSVLASDVAECLSQLEVLFVEKCYQLESLIEARKEAAMNKKIILPKLKSLILRVLPLLCSVSATIDLECPSLVHLYVVDCPKYSVPAPPQFQSKNQVQLNDQPNYDRLN